MKLNPKSVCVCREGKICPVHCPACGKENCSARGSFRPQSETPAQERSGQHGISADSVGHVAQPPASAPEGWEIDWEKEIGCESEAYFVRYYPEMMERIKDFIRKQIAAAEIKGMRGILPALWHSGHTGNEWGCYPNCPACSGENIKETRRSAIREFSEKLLSEVDTIAGIMYEPLTPGDGQIVKDLIARLANEADQ